MPFCQYKLIDRDGTVASFDLYFGMDADRDSLWAAIQAETRYQAVSECALYERKLWFGAAQVGAAAATGSSLSCAFVVMESDAQTYTTIAIPGIRSDLLLQNGCFAQQKIDMTHPDISALVAGVVDSQLVTMRGDPIIAVSSGGAVNMWSGLERRSG